MSHILKSTASKLRFPDVLTVGDTADCVASCTPGPEDMGGTLTWSLDGGSASFIQKSDTECVMIADAPGTGVLSVKYVRIGTIQGHAEDTELMSQLYWCGDEYC